MSKKQIKVRKDVNTRFKIGHLGYKGSNNAIWKGDNAGYNAIHIWLKSNFGKADKCENRLCTYPRMNRFGILLKKPKMFTWALLHGKKYSHERKNFVKLCVSCHKKYDSKFIHKDIQLPPSNKKKK